MIVVFLMLSLSINLYAQKRDDIRFIHLNEGLSQSTVTCITQDSKGYMWFGTHYGLNKYDGTQFTIYLNDPHDSTSLSKNVIRDILEDSQGNLWIGTNSQGINLYDRNHDCFIRYIHDPHDSTSLSHNAVNVIYEDSKENMWVGTQGGGLNLFEKDSKSFVHFRIYDEKGTNFIHNNVQMIHEDGKGNLWIGFGDSELRLFDRNKKRFNRCRYAKAELRSLDIIIFTCWIEDDEGHLWIGTQGTGLISLRMDNAGQVHYTQFLHDENNQESLSNNSIASIHEDKSGNLWIGTENGGLNYFNKDTKCFYHYINNPDDETSISSNSIWSIYEDNAERLWIGTFNRGLNVVNRYYEKFKLYKHRTNDEKSLSPYDITNFNEDDQGNLWIATDGGGLDYFDRGRNAFVHYKYNKNDMKSIRSNAVLSLCRDSKDKLWIGTWAGGISVLNKDRKTFTHYNTDNSDLSSNNIFAFAEDQNGYMYIATFGGGLNIYEKSSKRFIHYTYIDSDSSSLSGDNILSLHLDKSQNLWLGVMDNGLDLMRKSPAGEVSFTHYSHDPNNSHSLSDNIVNVIFEDSQNNFWIGTSTGGLNLMDRENGTFKAYRKQDGLPSDAIVGIVEDNQGNLWISTQNGLSKFNPKAKTFKNYDISDGLQGNEFLRNASYQCRNGEMLFGGRLGFNTFHPEQITENPIIPHVFITDFKIFNKSVGIGVKNSPLLKHISETEKLKLSYKHSVISFGFIALNYTHSEKNQYAYMMEGFDKEWNYVGNKREANYTNLDPGKYVFRVKASNNDDIWNEEGTSIQITITPPFWETLVFRIFLLIVIALCILGIIEYRIYGIKKQKKKLESLVAERTQDLGTANQELEIQQQRLLKNADALKRSNEELEQFAYVASHDLQEPLRMVSSYVGLLQKRFQNKLDLDAEEFINFALDGTKRMSILIQDLLNFSRITTQTNPFESIDAEDILQAASDNLQITINETSTEVTHSPLPTIMVDQHQLIRLFQNLIGNAIKYNQNQPKIHISSEKKDNQWLFAFKDNGIGIDPQYQDRIFGIFQRLHGRDEYSGTGIGLAVGKKIVERHGGEIWVESEGKGKGSLFKFTIHKK